MYVCIHVHTSEASLYSLCSISSVLNTCTHERSECVFALLAFVGVKYMYTFARVCVCVYI